MTGEKEDSGERLRRELQDRLREKGLSKTERKLIRAQLAAVPKSNPHKREDKAAPPKETPKVTPQAQARLDAMDLREQNKFIMDRQGAYKAAWIKYFSKDGSDVAAFMGDVAMRLNAGMAIAEKVLSVDQPDDALVHELDAVVAEINGTVRPVLAQVEALLRAEEAASGHQETIGDPMQVLDSLEASCDPKQWADAVKYSGNGKVVYGSSAVLARIAKLIDRYVGMWKGIKGDGNDEVAHKVLTAMNQVRMEIVEAIAESGDVMLMVCCAPGTEFHNLFNRLAAQSCRSHDVTIFAGWWAKNTKNSD
ncbi:MAG: hypothetical protein WBA97_29150 [Actinophytocola sp.]|uniref:hypothetical protein n=1 Tax=Actinophytocola sp. TaxID=1872138 RepID=UPI003C71C5FC